MVKAFFAFKPHLRPPSISQLTDLLVLRVGGCHSNACWDMQWITCKKYSLFLVN